MTTPRQNDDDGLRAWIIAQLGDEPDAVADDESSLIPVRWVPGVGLVDASVHVAGDVDGGGATDHVARKP